MNVSDEELYGRYLAERSEDAFRILLVCLSGRGDKDLENILAYKKSRSTMQNM